MAPATQTVSQHRPPMVRSTQTWSLGSWHDEHESGVHDFPEQNDAVSEQSTFVQQSAPWNHSPEQHFPPVLATHWWFDACWHAVHESATHRLFPSHF